MLNREFTTLDKYGTHTIKVSEIYNGTIQSNSVQLKVGDYVKYGDKLIANTYTTDTDETGYTSPQIFTTNTNMLWRVLSVNGNNIELVATQNVLANDNTTGLYLCGQAGFLNAEIVLKNLCERLYNSTSGTARSIDVYDINKLAGFNPETDAIQYNDLYGQTFNYTSGGPFWNKTNNTFEMPSESNPIVVESTSYSYLIDENIELYDTLTDEPNSYDGDFSGGSSKFYWLATRQMHVDMGGVRASGRVSQILKFPPFLGGGVKVDSGFLCDCYSSSTSYAGEHSAEGGVRPIVTLNDSISIIKGAGTEQNPFEF